MDKVKTFNNHLEAGIRSISFLNALYPESIGFEDLLKVDYILIHSSDFGGPNSLHPQLPNRKGEFAVRRHLVREGLALMKRFGLVESKCAHQGIFYVATEEVEPFLKLMKSEYSLQLKENSSWCASNIEQLKKTSLNSIFKD